MPIRSFRPVVASRVAALALGLVVLPGGLAAARSAATPAADEVIATVGSRPVTRDYYENRLARLKESELPRDAQGGPLDTGARAGRLAFLDIIVNKELMAQAAADLGLGDDPQLVAAVQSLREYNAPTVMLADLVERPVAEPDDAAIQDWYHRLHEKREISYVLCNLRETAAKAQAALVAGRPWAEVAKQYNEGSSGPKKDFTLEVKWGVFEEALIGPIWALAAGAVSDPIETSYGWWVVRVDRVEADTPPPLDEALRQRIRDSIRARRVAAARAGFLAESRRTHDFRLDEAALWTIWLGLPENEVLIDPATNKPTPREQLKPLAVAPADTGRFFYQVRLGDRLRTVTIGGFKRQFDGMSVFERPRRTDMLGGVRANILAGVDKQLLLEEARARGYLEDPRVAGDVADKREQMMVMRLHEQQVKAADPTAEELQAFWQERGAEYDVPETRFGHLVVCASEAVASKARLDVVAGNPWPEILTRWSSLAENKKNGGVFGPLAARSPTPLAAALFALSRGGVTAPVRIEQGWAVARLDSVAPPRKPTLAEVTKEVTDRLRAQREEDRLQKLLVEWRQRYPVKIFEDRLAACRSWAQVQARPAASDVLRQPHVR